MPFATRALCSLLAIAALAGCSPLPDETAGQARERVDPSQWSGLSARFTGTAARFEFRFAGTAETFYKAHLSLRPDFSWDVYFNFISARASPMVQEDPHRVWQAYDCGATLYWRLEAVGPGILTGIQGPTTVEC